MTILKTYLNHSLKGDHLLHKQDSSFCSKLSSIVSGMMSASRSAWSFIYAENPVTKKRQFWFVPSFIEQLLGASMYQSLIFDQGGETFNSQWAKRVEKVGESLEKHATRKLDYEFAVIRSRQVNAWALPWGKIAIYEGLLRVIEKNDQIKGYDDITMDDKIAAVLSHEIVHSDARHTAQRLERGVLINITLMGLKAYLAAKESCRNNDENKDDAKKKLKENLDPIATFFIALSAKMYLLAGSRTHEYEADKYGMHLMKKAGYNPRAALWLQEYFISGQFNLPSCVRNIIDLFSTHPDSKKRLRENQKTYHQLSAKV